MPGTITYTCSASGVSLIFATVTGIQINLNFSSFTSYFNIVVIKRTRLSEHQIINLMVGRYTLHLTVSPEPKGNREDIGTIELSNLLKDQSIIHSVKRNRTTIFPHIPGRLIDQFSMICSSRMIVSNGSICLVKRQM